MPVMAAPEPPASHDARLLSRCPFESQMICCSCCLENKGCLRVICRGKGCFHIVCTSCAEGMVCPHCSVPKKRSVGRPPVRLVGSPSSLLRLDGVPGTIVSVEDYLTAVAEPKKVEPEKCDKIGSKRPNKAKDNVCNKKPAGATKKPSGS